MTALRSDLPALPRRMQALPVDPRGFPVPWFVGKVNGQWDFRVIRPHGVELAIKFKLCWLCGVLLGVHKAFVIGPMCVVNRVTSEPPCHLECAIFAATACPFLTHPLAKRPDISDLEGITSKPAGIHIDRNPGVTCVYVTRTFERFRADAGERGYLIELGAPESVHWYARGRKATRAEIEESVNTGLPYLERMAEKDGGAALHMLQQRVTGFRELLRDTVEA